MAKAGGIAGGIILMLVGLLASGVSFGGLPVLNSQLDPQIPGSLQMLRDTGSAMVEEMIPPQFVDQLTPQRTTAITTIKGMLPTQAGTVLGAVSGMILSTIGASNLPGLVNGSVSYMTLAGTLDAVNESVGDWPTTLNMFFNAPNFQALTGGASPVQGVSEWFTSGVGTIGVPAASQLYLTAGNAGAPGLLTADIGGGVPGILGFLTLVATNPAGAMAAYAVDSGNLTAVADYLTTYLFPLVPTILGAELGFTVPACTPATASTYILIQWATKFLMPTGFPLPLGVGGANIVGWESPAPMTLVQAQALWNPLNKWGLINATGLAKWQTATTSTLKGYLAGNNSLHPTLQVEPIVAWMNTSSGTFLPVLRGAVALQAGVPMVSDYNDLCLRLFLAQWDHLALMPKTLLAAGSGLYFELELALANRIPSDTLKLLWNDTNANSLTNDAGMAKWVKAGRSYSVPEYNELQTAFSLTEIQMTAVAEFANRLLSVAALTYGVPNDAHVYERLFLTQWDHLALLGEPLEYEGVTGLEVNMPTGHHLTTNVAMMIWDDESELAITNEVGWAKWAEAAYDRNSTTYTYLQEHLTLTDTQMRYMCDWVVLLRETVVPNLADALEMVPVTIAPTLKFLDSDQGNLIMGGIGGFGAGLTILGLVMAIAFGRKK